jgi:YVTN family beta-propeller protein
VKRRGSLAALVMSAVVPIVAAAAGVIALSGCAACQSTVRQFAVPAVAAGSFDGVEADQTAHRLYLANRTTSKVDTIDTSSATPRFAGSIDVGAAPNGLAVAPELHRLYAGLSGGDLAVIDTQAGSPTYMQVIKTVKVDTSDADLLDYSPSLQQVFVSTGTGGEVVGVDAVLNELKVRYMLRTNIGQPRYDPADGMLYVTTQGNDSLLRINPASGTVVNTIKVKGCRPNGLAINPGRQLALTTCRSSVAAVNLRTGAWDANRVVAGGDIVSYDAALDRFVVASPHDRSDSAVGVFYGDGTFLGSVAATPAAHGAAFDVRHGLLYAPAALGLMSFAPGACEPPPDGVRFAGGMSFFVVPLLAAALFLVWYARRPKNREPDGPTYEQLRQQDLEHERERMREFEDSMFGPVNQGLTPEP